MFSILKYEDIWEGDYRKLLVKNITSKDMMEFSCEAKGDKCSAKLSEQSPWTGKFENEEGWLNGIAVMNVMVLPYTQVTWYIGNKEVNKKNFRFVTPGPLGHTTIF